MKKSPISKNDQNISRVLKLSKQVRDEPDRLKPFCIFFGIAYDKAFEYLKSKDFIEVRPNVTLLNYHKQWLLTKFRPDLYLNPPSFLNTSSPKFSEEENYKEQVLLLKYSLFSKVVNTIRYKSFAEINSFFTHDQAIRLCSKMSSSYARAVSKRASKLISESVENISIYEAHFIANKALSIFGNKMLTFIYMQRKLAFKNSTAIEVNTYSKVIPDFPLISFILDDKTKFRISFFVKRSKISGKLCPDIRMFSSKEKVEIGKIDCDGFILSKLTKFRPQLSLFYEKINLGQFEIFSGVEDGVCECCKLPLTHPTSLRIGLGPICAKNWNLDGKIYTF